MNTKSLTVAAGLAFLLGATPVATGGPAAGHSSRAGGVSAGHMSEAGRTNTNAQFLPDSQRGLDRAAERMSEPGLEHEQATSQEKAQGKTGKKQTRAAKQKP